MAACYKCNKPILAGIEAPLTVDAICDQCSSWLHCCANCTHYDEYSYSKCKEPRAEYVFDRVGKNNCAFFRVKVTIRDGENTRQKKMSPRGEQKDREGKARENLAKLFRM